MKFHSRRRVSPVITVIPLIDILMILLIFFIVTTTFKSVQPQVQIVLPAMKSAAPAKAAAVKPAILSIDEKDNIYLDDKTISKDELGAAVKRLQESGRKVALKADIKSSTGRMFEVLDSLQLADLKEMPVLTREGKK